MTNCEVKMRLMELQSDFPSGKYWNHSSLENQNLDSYTNTPCGENGYICNTFSGGSQCFAFANYMAYRVFGSYPTISAMPPEYNGTEINGWKIYTSGHCNDLTIESGDIIRTGNANTGHSAIVCDVDGNSLTVAEVWGSYGCKIAWGNYNGNSSNTVSHLKQTATFIAKAPKDGSSVTPPALANTYKITNAGASKCLNIHGDNLTSLYDKINVTLWSDSGSNEQKWVVSNLGNSVYIKSVIDTAYGLNVYRSGDPYNCNIHKIAGNETDALVDIIASGSYYKVKLHNYDLYLTVGASTNGTNVYWDEPSSSNYQKWTFTQVS